MLKDPSLFYRCIFQCLTFTLLFGIHIFYLALFYITRACEQQTFFGNTSAVHRLISHRTSGSFVFATEDGCWSSQTCIANLKPCVSTSRKCLFMPTFTLPTPYLPNSTIFFVPCPSCKSGFYSAPPFIAQENHKQVDQLIYGISLFLISNMLAGPYPSFSGRQIKLNVVSLETDRFR